MANEKNAINIVFSRVDNRLVHGQVGKVWANNVGANLILVVDDEVAEDKIQQSLMKMTVASTNIGIRFWSVKHTIENIWNASPSQKIFILTKTPKEIRQLIEGEVPIQEVNLGNMHSGPGKELLAGEYVYVDEEDKEDIEAIKDSGAIVNVQVLPEYKRYIV